MNDTERRIRDELGIPSTAKRILILSQAAHLDWDWQNWFSTNTNNKYPPDQAYYFNPDSGISPQPADSVYRQAFNLLTSFDDYFYSTCEMGFLQAFAEAYPTEFEAMRDSGRLRIVGGGITSPDNLLPNGETFIRNFLVGLRWLDSVNMPWSGKVWIPDDFGHDSQLPVTLDAMAVQGVGFSRIPGSVMQGWNANPPGIESATEMLLDETSGGVDFIWRASDSSTVLAHWMEDSYSQGDTINGSGNNVYGSPGQILNHAPSTWASNPNEYIGAYLGANGPVSPTPYIYVPVSNDFALPKGGAYPPNAATNQLVQFAEDWNNTSGSDTHVIVSTFDHYVDAVNAFLESNPTSLRIRAFHGSNNLDTFRPTPYWMGFYASRMELKRLHQQATRLALAAESFEAVAHILGAQPVNSLSAHEAWVHLVPSTHHDYITGTATDYVYNGEYQGVKGEQITRLEKSIELGQQAFDNAAVAISAGIPAQNSSVVVFNPLGQARFNRLLEFDPGTTPILPDPPHTQRAANGNLLMFVTLPGMGYKTYDLTTSGDKPQGTATCTVDGNGDVILENDLLAATISKSNNWSVSAIVDKLNTGSNILGGPSNGLSFYNDGGNIYRFGFETDPCTFSRVTTSVVGGPIKVTEEGPLRATVTASSTYSSSAFGQDETYQLEYSLVAGEPYLRVRIMGAAPTGTSVMTTVRVNGNIGQLDHGTPTHWDTKQAWSFGSTHDFNAVVEATHDFVIARAAETALVAVFHASVPAWAANGPDLTAVILRNTPGNGCENKGAAGSDPDPHTIDYAIALPSYLDKPKTGSPLIQARNYNTPMTGIAIAPAAPQPALPAAYTLANVDTPDYVMVLAAKLDTATGNDLIVRVYHPSNETMNVTLSTSVDALGTTGATALERPLSAQREAELNIKPSGTDVSYTATRALTTLRIPLKS